MLLRQMSLKVQGSLNLSQELQTAITLLYSHTARLVQVKLLQWKAMIIKIRMMGEPNQKHQ